VQEGHIKLRKHQHFDPTPTETPVTHNIESQVIIHKYQNTANRTYCGLDVEVEEVSIEANRKLAAEEALDEAN
jgi:hypothetical protein